VASTPTFRELPAANCNCQESASEWYQRSDSPGGGNRSDSPLVNETATTISVGAASRNSATAAKPPATDRKLSVARPDR
jgi:hypothetical protein